jgi:hypothetical protein
VLLVLVVVVVVTWARNIGEEMLEDSAQAPAAGTSPRVQQEARIPLLARGIRYGDIRDASDVCAMSRAREGMKEGTRSVRGDRGVIAGQVIRAQAGEPGNLREEACPRTPRRGRRGPRSVDRVRPSHSALSRHLRRTRFTAFARSHAADLRQALRR